VKQVYLVVITYILDVVEDEKSCLVSIIEF